MTTAAGAREPFYSADGITIWHGDARALPLGTECVDLVVTSWPHNARVPYDGYTDWLPGPDYWDGLIAPFLAEAFRVLRHGGRLALITQPVMHAEESDSPLSDGGFVAKYAERAGFLPVRDRFTWIKRQHAGVDSASELVWVFDKGVRRDMPRDGAPADLSAVELEEWTRNTWYITRGSADVVLGHAATFPLALPRRLIKLYSYPGETVLDPFMGAGTTLRAARSLRRVGLGVEQSRRYCRLAASLCAQEALP
jgi:hypothetical protein